LNALKAGTNALNKLHEDMSIEDVEKLLEETNEAIEVRFQAIDEISLTEFDRLKTKLALCSLVNSQHLMKVNWRLS
jgi:hypothetical protein